MGTWLDFFANENFMPHGHCYQWRPDILWTHVGSDIVITLAYYTIPIVLGAFLYKRKQAIPFPEIVALFVAFIFLCGTTHLVSIYVTWYPAYEQQGWLKALTALVSIATAIALVPKLPQLLVLPGIQQAYLESQEILRDTQAKKKEMDAVYRQCINREENILSLKEEINSLLKAQNLPQKYLIEIKSLS